MTVIPLVWHGRQQGILVLQHPNHLKRRSEQVLQELAAQLAPNLDNMLLYDEVQRQKTLIDSVFAESPTGIAVVGADGRIVQSNQELAALFGGESMPMQSLAELLEARNGEEALVSNLRTGMQNSQSFSIDEVTLGSKTVRIDLAPLQAYKLWIVTIGDITALVELSKLKTRLLRIASHDLKNPLSRIMGFAELLDMQVELKEQHQRYLRFILDAADEMLRIINDILNLERLRSGTLVFATINLTQLTREVCASHQPCDPEAAAVRDQRAGKDHQRPCRHRAVVAGDQQSGGQRHQVHAGRRAHYGTPAQ
jgi:signal transduction histidine kinase